MVEKMPLQTELIHLWRMNYKYAAPLALKCEFGNSLFEFKVFVPRMHEA